jgi:dihydrofolate synthase/folylpolyglutamate synthase
VTINNLKEAEAALAAYASPQMQITRKDITLKRLRPFMPLIGNPQTKLRVIHVAGTSGKTSTAYYIAALLAATGKKTGLAVSPHIDTVTERIQINGQNISEADFCSELSVYLELAQVADPRPSYFELLHAFTLWYMARQKVFYVVVETGVGGLHDATNINNRADKVCVITDIGFDHTDLLGKTLPAIAGQKIGIAHKHNNVFMYRQAGNIMNVIEAWTERHEAPLHVTTEAAERPAYVQELTPMPGYQQRNWLLAHYVYEYLKKRDSLANLTSQALSQTQQIHIPGRMDVKQVGDKTVVMDGAHNEQKMQAFVSSFRALYPGVKPAMLVGFKEGKDYRQLVPMLASLTNRIITTTFSTAQDLPVVSMDAEVLAQAFRAVGVAQVESIPDNWAAWQALMAAPEAVRVITGSFYLIGQIRNNEH